MTVLREEFQARERVIISYKQTATIKHIWSWCRTYLWQEGALEPHTAMTLVSGVGPEPVNCCYCQQSRPFRDCKVVTQSVARKQLLPKLGRCFACLQTDHIGHDCHLKSQASSATKNITHWSVQPGTPVTWVSSPTQSWVVSGLSTPISSTRVWINQSIMSTHTN